MQNSTITAVAIVISAALASAPGCGGRASTAPTTATPVVEPPAAVTVTTVDPNNGPANATTFVRVFGSGFEPGAILTIGARAIEATVVSSTLITAAISAHPAATVDVVVTNPGARSGTLWGGFTFVRSPGPATLSISPTTGSTLGGTHLTIRGDAFDPAAIVELGGIVTTSFVHAGSIYLTAPPHGAGPVDVVVTNPGVAPQVLVRGYTYAAPESFDFNGTWEGSAGSEDELSLRFTVEHDVLTSVSCGGAAVVKFASPPVVRNGEISFSTEGVAMTGRILSPTTAAGTLDSAACRRVPWAAAKPSPAVRTPPP